MPPDPSTSSLAASIFQSVITFLSDAKAAIFTEPFKSIITALSGAAIAIFAEPIRQWLFHSNLVLSFDNDEECVSRTFHTSTTLAAKGPGAVYIRIRVKNTRKRMARECRGYLINLEEKTEKGSFEKTEYCDSVMLHWSCQREETKYLPIHIPSGVNQFLDVIALEENWNYFMPQLHVFLNRYHELVRRTGVFRFTIQVVADNVKPKTIKLIFEWNGQWNNFKVYKDQ